MAIVEGADFNSYVQLRNALTEYEKENYINLYHALSIKLKTPTFSNETCVNFQYKRLKLKCKYGGNVRKTVKKNIRNTKSYKKGCPAEIHDKMC